MAAPTQDRLRWLEELTLTRVVFLGCALRVGWLLLCPNEPVSDQTIYHAAARDLALGLGFIDDSGNPHGWWPVGYPAALAPFYALLGAAPLSGHIANVLFGGVLIAGVMQLAGVLFGARPAALAGLTAAVHPTFVLLTTVHASENLFVAVAIWGSWALARAAFSPRHTWKYAALGALLVGLSAYVRAPGLLLAAVFPVLAWCRRMPWLRLGAVSLMIGLLAIAVLVPWGFRTQKHFGTFQMVSMNGASNFWMGNHEGSSGSYTGLPDEFAHTPIPQREAELRQRALTFIKINPGQYLTLCLNRLQMTLRSDTIAPTWNGPGLKKRLGEGTLPVLKVLCTLVYLSVWLLLGLALWRRRGDWHSGDAAMLTAAVFSAVPFVLIVGGNRYHLPLAPYLWVWMASIARPSPRGLGTRTR